MAATLTVDPAEHEQTLTGEAKIEQDSDTMDETGITGISWAAERFH